jgi:hypothetical protein
MEGFLMKKNISVYDLNLTDEHMRHVYRFRGKEFDRQQLEQMRGYLKFRAEHHRLQQEAKVAAATGTDCSARPAQTAAGSADPDRPTDGAQRPRPHGEHHRSQTLIRPTK